MDEIAKLLKTDAALKLRVMGHTDNQGGLDSNIALSKRRPEAVTAALVSQHGIAAGRFQPTALATWRLLPAIPTKQVAPKIGAWSWFQIKAIAQ